MFVTVGTQLPFDRLIAAVDRWAATADADVFAQTGSASYVPEHMAWKRIITGTEANDWIRTADLVVAHAGMGTILTRCETGLPIIVMPRRAELGEHRNEHQSATAKRLAHLPGLTVAENEVELFNQLRGFTPLATTRRMEAVASPMLLAAISEFIAVPRHAAANMNKGTTQ
ncbi:glycosyltransferase [Aestuariivirga litoralis]|uniref:glycosyltransferase n=1 Tax=Aestuariivirga litoralis TaxID=2650924 RepID=UPI001379902A|nr:glycosyltransferase [Aestuariivirga litoralis]